jgi:hypothetical protein
VAQPMKKRKRSQPHVGGHYNTARHQDAKELTSDEVSLEIFRLSDNVVQGTAVDSPNEETDLVERTLPSLEPRERRQRVARR